MKHDLLDGIFGGDYLGSPVDAEETWPRSGAALRNGDIFSTIAVPNAYRVAIGHFELDEPDSARNVVRTLRTICSPFDETERQAEVEAALTEKREAAQNRS